MDISITLQDRNIQSRYSLVEINLREWPYDPRSQFDDIPPYQCRARVPFYLAGTALGSPVFVHLSDDRLPPRDSSAEPALLQFFLETTGVCVPTQVDADASGALRQQCRSVWVVLGHSLL